MKQFRDLTIEGTPEALQSFWAALKNNTTDWTDVSETTDTRYLPVQVPKDRPFPAGTIYLYNDEGAARFIVTNIVPAGDDLTIQEYNDILEAFYRECVSPLAKTHSVTANLSSDNLEIDELLSHRNVQLLRSFSRLANKSSRASHPADRERWMNFIAGSIQEGEILDSEILQQWLVEDGWPRDIAADLVGQYEFGVNLAKHFATEGATPIASH